MRNVLLLPTVEQQLEIGNDDRRTDDVPALAPPHTMPVSSIPEGDIALGIRWPFYCPISGVRSWKLYGAC